MQTQATSTGTPGALRASVYLFVALASFYLLLARGRITSGDEWHIYGTAESLAENGSWHMKVKGIDRAFSRYSVVPSILGVPFCKAAGPVADRLVNNDLPQPDLGSARRSILMAATTFETPFVTAATAAILCLGLCRLGIRPGPAVAAAAVFGLGTLALPYSGSLYVQPIAAFALICIVLSAALGRPIALAISLVLLLAIRAEMLAILPALVFHAVKFHRPVARHLGWTVAGAAIGFALNVVVNVCREDHWLAGDYGTETFSTPLWVGLWGVLFSSGKGLVWFAPAAAAGLVLLPRFAVAVPRVGLLAAGVTATMLIMVACWWTWHGAWSWGPRLLVPLMPVLVLPIAWLFQDWQHENAGMRWTLILVVIASVVVQFPGVLRDPSADRIAMGLLIGGNENESIYIPQVGPWGAETAGDFDILLCRLWNHAPQYRTAILIVAAVLLTLVATMSWCALRSAGVRVGDVRGIVPQTRPAVLLAGAGALVLLSAPTAVQWRLLVQSADDSAARAADLPRQFQSVRAVSGGRWAGNLYVPLRGDYTFFQQGPALSQFFLDGSPLFSAQSGPVAIGFAKMQVGFHRLEIDGGVTGHVNPLYWTTPGNAHYKEPIPRLYLAGPNVAQHQQWAITLSHWKWTVWTLAIVAFLFLAIRPESDRVKTER